MGKQSFIQRVEQAVEAILESEGFELVLVEYLPRTHILRLFIDKLGDSGDSAGDSPASLGSGITLDDCTRVSHLVGDLLDAEGLSDAVEGSFTLEVSSPGVDRPLSRPRHFERFVGSNIQVTTKEPPIAGSGRRKFSGALLEAQGSGIRMDVDGAPFDIHYDQIERARLVPDF